MGVFRFIKYKYLLKKRSKYASLALSLALAHASFGQVKYKSLGNGMADIELSLDQDQKVKLHFNRLDDKKDYIVRGKWTVEDSKYILKFKRSRLDIATLFSDNPGFSKAIKVEDKRTVSISSQSGGVFIWGIYCPRLTV